MPDCRQEIAGRLEPSRDVGKQLGVLCQRHVDDGVERDYGVKGFRREGQFGDVATQEVRRRNKLLGSLNLHFREVDAGDVEVLGK